ncbi:PIG-L deacetylase family protein [Streptomyces sp. NPDC001231]|uniref:PIG-L deacetylase family protein n=1 Tax=Streptomyces sp. NPDC001231 TaxID=3364549 RepID=UPI0036CF8363
MIMQPAHQTGPDERGSSASTAPTTLPSLLAVFAHPDDESLLAGGVLARHSASGARTAVVTTTWGSDSARAPELAAALSILGAGSPHMLAYSDARNDSSAPGRPRLCDTPMDEVVGDLVSHIRDFRPTTVVTHDALGQMTGHPDHRYTHQATLLAVEAAALGSLHRERGVPWQTEAIYLATHAVSGGAALAAALYTVGKSALTVPDAYVSTTADVSVRSPLLAPCPASSPEWSRRHAKRSWAPSSTRASNSLRRHQTPHCGRSEQSY